MELGEPLVAAAATFESGGGFDGPTTQPIRWKIVRQFEAFGANGPKNIILYSWRHWQPRLQPTDQGDNSTLEDIYYTPPLSGSENAEAYAHHIHFRYQSDSWRSPSSRFVFEPPGLRPAERLIRSIEVSSRGTQALREQVRRYWLSYETIAGRPYLANVVLEGRCAGGTPETFASDGRRDLWQLPEASSCPRALPGTTYTYTHSGALVPGGYVGARAPVKLTFEGSSPKLAPRHIAIIDANRDGLADFIQAVPGVWGGNNNAPTNAAVHVNGGRAGEPISRAFERKTYTGQPLESWPEVLTGDGYLLTVSGFWDDYWGAGWMKGYSYGSAMFPFSLAPTATGFESRPHSGCPIPGSCPSALPPTNAFGDINSDGLVDALYRNEATSPAQTRIRLSERTSGGSVTTTLAFKTDISTNLRLRSGQLAPKFSAFADINGDGIVDYVCDRNPTTRVVPTLEDADYRLVFIPGRGSGDFGCQTGNSLCIPAVGSPGFNETTPASSLLEVRIHGTAAEDPAAEITVADGPVSVMDLTGDGKADIVKLFAEPGGGYVVDVWVNADGAGGFIRDRVSFPSGDFDLSGAAPPDFPYSPRLLFGDIDGDGIQDLVVCGDNECVYRSYSPLHPPGLLTRIDHEGGSTTEIDYHASLREMELEQETEPSLNPWPSEGPWSTHAPVAVWPVKTVRQHNNAPYPYSVSTRADYQYRDPAYDRWSSSLRGFRHVRTTSADHAVDTRFYFEGCLQSDADAVASGGGCIEPQREGGSVQFAMNGRPLVVEHLSASTGAYHSTTVFKYAARNPLYGGGVFVYPRETQTYLYDTSDFWASPSTITLYSPTQKEYTVNIRAAHALIQQRQEYDDNGNLVASFDDGRVTDLGTAIDRPIRTQYVWQATNTSQQYALGRQYLLSETRTCYAATSSGPCGADGSGALLSNSAGLDGGLRQVVRGYDDRGRLLYAKSFIGETATLERISPAPQPSGMSSGGQSAYFFRVEAYDEYGNPTKQLGSTGECQTFTYEPTFADYVIGTTTWLGANCTGPGLATSVGLDRGLGLVTKQVSANHAESGVDFDGFGRARLAWAKPNDGPRFDTMSFEYSPSDQAIHWVHATRLAVNPANSSSTWTLSDSLGSSIATLTQADPSAGDGGEWIVKSSPSRDLATGRPVEWFRPAFYSGSPLDLASGSPVGASAASATYDFMGRTIETYRASDGHITSHRAYHPLSIDTWDGENIYGSFNHLEMYSTVSSDGHGRQIEARKQTETGAVSTVTDYLATGELAVVERREGSTVRYRRWLKYDSRGKLVQNAEPNTSTLYADTPYAAASMKSWRYAYDLSGHLVGTSDARGCGKNLTYDLAGRPISEDWASCPGSPAYTPYNPATGDGSEVLYRYDFIESGQWGDYGTNALALWGKLVSVRDRGAHTRFAYDSRGRTIGTARRIAKPGSPISSMADRYTSHWFRTSVRYDEVDRVQQISTGADISELLTGYPGELLAGSSVLAYNYSARGVVSSVEGSYGTLLQSQRLAADGAPELQTFGDFKNTQAVYDYDDNRRLWKHNLVQSAGEYEYPLDLIAQRFSYDEVGNVRSIADYRDPTRWAAGAKPVSREMSFDSLYRLTSVSYDHGGDEQISPFQHEEAASDGRPLPRLVNGARVLAQWFNHDSLGNVTEAHDEWQTSFDRGLGMVTMGDRSAATDEARKPNRLQYADGLVAPSGVEAHYDAAGNLTDLAVERIGTCSAPIEKCSHRFLYEWDEMGQLTRARRWDYTSLVGEPQFPALPVGSPSADLSYKYSQGKRVLKTAADPGGPSHTVDVFPTLRLNHADYAGTDYERNASTETVYLPGYGRVQYRPGLPNAGSDLHVFLEFGDHLGNATVVIDKDTSQLVEYATYLAYGATETDYRPTAWMGFREDHRFTGKEEDVEVGLSYFEARYYSPYLARFISPDPATIHGLSADLNPYAYVAGRVYNQTDPTGLDPEGSAVCLFCSDPPAGSSGPGGWTGSTSSGGMSDGGGQTPSVFKSAIPTLRAAPAAAAGWFARGWQALSSVRVDFGDYHITTGNVWRATANDVNGFADMTALSMGPTSWVGLGIRHWLAPREEYKLQNTGSGDVSRWMPVAASIAQAGISGAPALLTLARQGIARAMMAMEPAAAEAILAASDAAASSASRGVSGAAEAMQVAAGTGGAGDVAPATVLREIKHGEKVADLLIQLRDLHDVTGLEHAIVSRTTGGPRVIVYGGAEGIDFANFALRRVLLHTHPLGFPSPSGADFGILQSLGQRSSWILEEGLIRFGVRTP